jgi:hypothetical protein
MPRRRALQSFDPVLEQIARRAANEIVSVVRAHVAAAFQSVLASLPEDYAHPTEIPRIDLSLPDLPALAVAPAPASAAAAIGEPAAAEAPVDGAAAPTPRRTASDQSRELLEAVLSQLNAVFFGRPVTAERLALILKQDPVLVDAALALLAQRKEVRAKWQRGRLGYVPVRPLMARRPAPELIR